MLIEYIRRDAVGKYRRRPTASSAGCSRTIKGMLSIAELPGATINNLYRIYEKAL